mmetsp:Transcript_262/g.436  ORF Transcript_262/g.436 Transcript_262/m.436 type:complete len:85 (+) Transcript_262:116-370(+)
MPMSMASMSMRDKSYNLNDYNFPLQPLANRFISKPANEDSRIRTSLLLSFGEKRDNAKPPDRIGAKGTSYNTDKGIHTSIDQIC